MARQDDDKRRKELEEKTRREDEAAAEQELAAGPTADTDAVPAGPEQPVRKEAEPPGADVGAVEVPREPPAPPK